MCPLLCQRYSYLLCYVIGWRKRQCLDLGSYVALFGTIYSHVNGGMLYTPPSVPHKFHAYNTNDNYNGQS